MAFHHQDDAPSAAARVLVVDDNADAVEALAMLLSLTGYEVRTAALGEEALVLARTFDPHVVLLDLTLPGVSGEEVAQRLRESAGAACPLLIATSGRPIAARGVEASYFDHHFLKPLPVSRIFELIDNELAGRVDVQVPAVPA
jgi:DNA-binding response OmpR family regulator